MADQYQKEFSSMLHRYDIFTRHEKAIPLWNGKRVVGWNTPERSTPDLTGGLVHQIHVEVKTGKNGRFDFSSWTEAQRAYAHEWRIRRGCEYWLGIMIETPDSPYRVKRTAFLVPYPIMIRTEAALNGIQNSIPYTVKKGLNKEIQDKRLVAQCLWLDFVLDWVPGKGWNLPYNHAFSKMYIGQKPYLYEDDNGS